jgi:hypothetical protein
MPCWPEALEALARYMVILLTVGCMPVPGDYVKVRVNPSDHPRLVRPSSPGQLPLLVLSKLEVLLVRTFSLCFFSCLNLLLRGLVCVCCTT